MLCFTAGDAGTPPSLASAIEAVREAGLAVAWSGLTRNAVQDIERETPIVVVADDLAAEVRSLLATGTANLLFDREAPEGAALDRPVRVCVASYEVVGPTKNGGIGTAATSMAELLGAAGHDVTLLYTGWQALDDAGAVAGRGITSSDRSASASSETERPSRWTRRTSIRRAPTRCTGGWPRGIAMRRGTWCTFPDCQGHGYYALLARRLGSRSTPAPSWWARIRRHAGSTRRIAGRWTRHTR